MGPKRIGLVAEYSKSLDSERFAKADACLLRTVHCHLFSPFFGPKEPCLKIAQFKLFFLVLAFVVVDGDDSSTSCWSFVVGGDDPMTPKFVWPLV